MPFIAGQPAWNRGKTKESDPRVHRMSETLRTKGIDNLAQWRQMARLTGRIPNTLASLMRSEQLAFLIGMTLGDGHVHKFPRSEQLHIVLGTDKPLLWQHVAKLVQNVFGKEPRVWRRKGSAAVDISLYQTRLSERLGVPAGNRGKLEIRLPEWIRSEQRYLGLVSKDYLRRRVPILCMHRHIHII